MVIVHIKGGLGNQLFQYAYGRVLMEKGRDVMFDISFFSRDTQYTKRNFRLESFLLNKDSHFEKSESKQSLPIRIFNKIDGDRRVRFARYYKDKKDGVADGDYLSEKYFSHLRKDLLKEVAIKKESSLFLSHKKSIIESENSLVVHARRTDYLYTAGLTNLDKDYYGQARTFFPKSSTIFCFSDDPEWVKDLFPGEIVTVVSGSGLEDFEELMLMSYGKNFIIANSTFSWWGAWLSQAKDKRVIAPKKWFTKKLWWRANRDVVPESWIRI